MSDDQTSSQSPDLGQTGKPASQFVVYSLDQAYRHLTQKRPEQELALYLIVDELLFNVWDALCLSIDSEYREEYLPYLPQAFDLLVSTTNGEDLWEYLVFIEETKLGGIKEDNLARARASRVVDLLLEYKKKLLLKTVN
jgi:hypothetical protein